MKLIKHRSTLIAIALLGSGLVASSTSAAQYDVTVKIENLAPANSVSFAPLRLGFGNGTFDAFNTGAPASPAIISIAEGGSGAAWFPAFHAAEPGSILGSVGGALTPGASAMSTFRVDPSVNKFFTFASMAIPSNDLFIGNDDPAEYQIFDASGNLMINSISQTSREIWDANSEVADPANAAFVAGGINANRTPENGLIAFDSSELNAFNGLNTPAGYVVDMSSLNGQEVYRISFTASRVPDSSSMLSSILALGTLACLRLRK